MTKFKSILVIEDDKAIRESIVQACGLLPNVRVIEAENGKLALESLHADMVPDLILVDLQMPELSGQQFVEKLRALPLMDKVPVLVTSGAADLDGKIKNLDVQGHIRKPFDLYEFIETLSQYLQYPSLNRPLSVGL